MRSNVSSKSELNGRNATKHDHLLERIISNQLKLSLFLSDEPEGNRTDEMQTLVNCFHCLFLLDPKPAQNSSLLLSTPLQTYLHSHRPNSPPFALYTKLKTAPQSSWAFFRPQSNVLQSMLQQLSQLLEEGKQRMKPNPSPSDLLVSQMRRDLIRLVAIASCEETLTFLLDSMSSVPEAVTFWRRKQLRQANRLAVITKNKLKTLLGFDNSNYVSIEEKISALNEIYEAHLVKIGKLKYHIRELYKSIDIDEENDLLVRSFAVLKDVFDLRLVNFTKFPWHSPSLVSDAVNYESLCSKKLRSADENNSSLSVLKNNLDLILSLRSSYQVVLQKSIASCRPPSILRRRWRSISVFMIGTTFSCLWLFKHRFEFISFLKDAGVSIQDFFYDHMISPFKAIFGEILLNEKAAIADADALLDTKHSLRRMLSDFIEDSQPNLPQIEKDKLIENMSMSVISSEYEKEIPRALNNIFRGEIIRMLLIQVQFIKKELMVAMGAIDELMHANQLNLQIMATLPTFLVCGGLYKLTQYFSIKIFQFTNRKLHYNPRKVIANLNQSIRQVERFLNFHTTNSSHVDKAVVMYTQDYLDDRDFGSYLLMLDHLQNVFASHLNFFSKQEQENFKDDLNDLINEDLNVPQQLRLISRMYRTNSFLGASSTNVTKILF